MIRSFVVGFIMVFLLTSSPSWAGRNFWYICSGSGALEGVDFGQRGFVLQQGYYKVYTETPDSEDFVWHNKYEIRVCHDILDQETCQIYIDDVPETPDDMSGVKVRLVNRDDTSDVLFQGKIVSNGVDSFLEGQMEDQIHGQVHPFKAGFNCFESPWIKW